MNIKNGLRDKLLEILGNKLSAKEFDELEKFINSLKVNIDYRESDKMIIEVQNLIDVKSNVNDFDLRFNRIVNKWLSDADIDL